ncbi:hypothetical protein H0I39_09185 [Ottowia beijingensis]|uniref:Rad50/SbcC-type AAA domain-containing protein n=1 Tax=Ottowia beijingensis TaxID=1207057 RepID=A0A853IW63_9BURK|nr:hypothetical protein [Ottowia beijingensis]NZA01887.1 hypothetical protein [Ottowia beijingensis]
MQTQPNIYHLFRLIRNLRTRNESDRHLSRALARVRKGRERSKETFSPTKNLLAGINETGKSRVLKHMVWTLGCEPAARNAGSWDSNITAATELSIGSKKYIFLRSGRHQRAAFDADGKLVIGTESAKVWTKFLSNFSTSL